jgi:hypothetical protein
MTLDEIRDLARNYNMYVVVKMERKAPVYILYRKHPYSNSGIKMITRSDLGAIATLVKKIAKDRNGAMQRMQRTEPPAS